MAEYKQSKIKSPGLASEKKFMEMGNAKNIPKEVLEYTWFYQDRARKAFDQRERKCIHFDGLSYTADYYLNQQAANTYLRPKLNDDEVRVNTGTTEKKVETVWNELQQLNFEPEIRAFDKKDIPIIELGESFTDMVKRTNEIEQDDYLLREAILEGLTQRAVFIEEVWDDGTVRDKRENGVYRRTLGKARKRLVSGLKIFLGDITLPWYRFNDQPYIIKYDRIHWKEAEKMFKYDKDGKENPMWQYVSKGNKDTFNSIFGLRLGDLDEDEVEVLTYMSYCDDEYCRLLNGVPIDNPGTKLPWEYEGYNIQMFGLKTISRDFAYCKPLTASAKTLQALNNETIRMMIYKFRQALKPPMGAPSGRVFSKDIWSPASVTQGIKKDDIFSLIDHAGVTQSEFNMYDLIERKTEEFIGAGAQQQGLSNEGKQTATETQILQKQFTTQLGASVLMVMSIVEKMSYLRIYNLLEHVTQPIGKELDPLSQKINNTYMSFVKENADLGEGRMGRKEIIFGEQSFDPMGTEMNQLYEKEEEAKKIGKDFRKFYINIKQLLEIPIKWFVSVSQGFKESEALDKVMFADSLRQAVTVAQVAQRPLNGDIIVQDFNQTWKKKNWFQREAPPQLNPMIPGQEMAGSQVPGQMSQDKPQTPGINTLEGNIA